MRYILLAPMLLAACSGNAPQAQANPGAARIDCALGEGSQFGPDCLVEKVSGEEGPEFIVRHPDGGFRRLKIAADRAGMVALDGADEVVNSRNSGGGVLEVAVGPDRYRFPPDLDAKR
jgi:hypothetical protein